LSPTLVWTEPSASTDEGAVDIGHLGLLGGGAGGGAGGGGAPLGHGLSAQRELWKWVQAEEATAVRRKEEDGGGGVGWIVTLPLWFYS
jgi:hypothetical protein